MFLRCNIRKKDGKEHRYWSIVESRRCAGNKVVQRHVLYLGEINDQQQAAWQKSIEIFEHGQAQSKTVALFPEDRAAEAVPDCEIVHIRLGELQLRRPRQWGACWLFCHQYHQLGLDQFWAGRLPPSRKGTRWDLVLQTLCAYRLIDPGSEWRLHREWYEQSAMGDLLGEDLSLAEIHTLYDCHDLLLAHKSALFGHLTGKWKDLFNAKFDVLLYDLTSTYFESEPPFPEEDKRKFGYSRDKRPDCVQVVIGLIVTPEGFPLGYEVLAGNTSDKKTLKSFWEKIESQYGKAQRIWLMDRGIPTEATLKEMQESDPPVQYLVGTPKGRLSQLESQLAEVDWQKARPAVDVKLLAQDKEVYVLARSLERRKTDQSIRPILHQKLERIEAHIFVAFLAYCVHVSLGWRLKQLAPGLSVRSLLDKMAQMQMIDVHLPTTDGREVILSRYTQPEVDQKLLLEQLKLSLPSQPPPKITAPKTKEK